MSALPDLVDRGGLPNAIREGNPSLALDLSTIGDGIKLRELWNTVDIADFLRELRQLETEREDGIGPDAFESSGDKSDLPRRRIGVERGSSADRTVERSSIATPTDRRRNSNLRTNADRR